MLARPSTTPARPSGHSQWTAATRPAQARVVFETPLSRGQARLRLSYGKRWTLLTMLQPAGDSAV
jgi:hypothetical protein